MRFNFAAILASASALTGVMAAPAAGTDTNVVESRDVLDLIHSDKADQPKLSAAAALKIVHNLQGQLAPFEKKLKSTAHSITPKSSNKERQQAIASAKSGLSAMTQAIYKATEQVSMESTAKKPKKPSSGGGDVQALADALKTTLVTLAATVNTLLAVLGLTPLLAFLTPLTASLSGLVITLIPVVDSLLPILNTILDGVVTGLSGLLAGLIL